MSRVGEKRQKYTHLLFAGLLVVHLVAMAATSRRVSAVDGTEQSTLRAWALAVVTPIQSVFGSAFSGIGSIWTGYVDLRGARERNGELEVENARLRAEIEAARMAAAENERFRKLLDLKPLLKYDTVVAEVVARDSSAWFKYIVIDKGSLAGIERNQPVVTPDGLVGRVVEAGVWGARIQLITDEHAGAGARLVPSGAAGEIKGRQGGRCLLKSISSIQEVAGNEPVLTSGLDGIYPAGILIGYVESVTAGAGASPHDITVRPAAPLDRLDEVIVLKVSPSDLTAPETPKP